MWTGEFHTGVYLAFICEFVYVWFVSRYDFIWGKFLFNLYSTGIYVARNFCGVLLVHPARMWVWESVTVHNREEGFWRVTDSQRLLLYGETLPIRVHREDYDLTVSCERLKQFWSVRFRHAFIPVYAGRWPVSHHHCLAAISLQRSYSHSSGRLGGTRGPGREANLLDTSGFLTTPRLKSKWKTRPIREFSSNWKEWGQDGVEKWWKRTSESIAERI